VPSVRPAPSYCLEERHAIHRDPPLALRSCQRPDCIRWRMSISPASTETAGITLSRLSSWFHLHDWFEEFRLYHRKDGKVVKEGDDLMVLAATSITILP
jgi:hypothetical protein